eukprot:134172-Pleurochrysis_carterae.AAC.1
MRDVDHCEQKDVMRCELLQEVDVAEKNRTRLTRKRVVGRVMRFCGEKVEAKAANEGSPWE